MKKNIHYLSFLLIYLFSFHLVPAQNQLLTTGGQAIGTGGQISYSVGQLAYSLQVGPSFSLLVSIQQPAGIVVFPVELVYFRANGEDGKVALSWATASELNNDYFTVERSLHGITWEVVGNVPGVGNSTESTRYKLLDKSPFTGSSYYRLKQTDLDGSFTYSKIAAVSFDNKGIFIYPNPAKDFLQISLEGAFLNLSYTLYNATGSKMSSSKLTDAEMKVDMGNLPTGMYHLIISSEDEILTSTKILKN